MKEIKIEMIEDKKIDLKEEIKKLKEIAIQKEKTEKFLEMKAKMDKKTFLDPVVKMMEEQEKIVVQEIKLYKEKIQRGVSKFLSKKDSILAQKLLMMYEAYKSIKEVKIDHKIDDVVKPLFDYFIQTEDLESSRKFLEIRHSTTIDKKQYEEQKVKYEKFIKDFSKFEFTYKSDSIMGISKDRKDIIELVSLCGKLDARKFKDCDKIHYSYESKDILISAALTLYGSLHDYIYYDGEFGHSEKDRDILAYFYEESYKTEKKKIKEQESKLFYEKDRC